jgi:preprotein translocase subunit SecG
MNLSSIVRYTYVLGWLFAALSLVYRALQWTMGESRMGLPVSSRGVLFFSCFLFLACIATAAYEQVARGKTS